MDRETLSTVAVYAESTLVGTLAGVAIASTIIHPDSPIAPDEHFNRVNYQEVESKPLIRNEGVTYADCNANGCG